MNETSAFVGMWGSMNLAYILKFNGHPEFSLIFFAFTIFYGMCAAAKMLESTSETQSN